MTFALKTHLTTAAILLCSITLSGRVFFTGSNPVLSSIVFPQDNLLIPGKDNISFYTSWQTFPWWGDLDEPENKPNNEYIFSGRRTLEQHYKAGINQFDHTISVSRWLEQRKKLRFDITYTSHKMAAEANGTANEGSTPYSYSVSNAIRELYCATSYATYYKNHPVGIKIGIGGVTTSKPKLKHLMLNGSESVSSHEMFWGWNGVGQSTQQEFSTGSPLKFDLQVASTFERHKIGTRFRFYLGKLDSYTWNEDHYDVDSKRIYNYTFRLYGIYNWYSRDKFRFNTTALTRYTALDTVGVPSNDPTIRGSTARSKVFVLQVNPNVNIFPWKFPLSYIDAAILCNYQYTRFDFLGDNGRYLWTSCWRLEDVTDEEFSFGNENFVEAALDIYASIPVFGGKDRMAAIGISTLVWRKFKWLNKYFGHMEGNSFSKVNIRKNFDREMWLNTVVNFIYRQGRFMYRLDFGQPLIYSLTPRTMVYDGSGNFLRGKSKEKMWLAQSGFKVGFFISTDLENFMRYQPLGRPDTHLR